MKAIALAVSFGLFGSLNAFSQGTVYFNNLGSLVLQAPEKGGAPVPAGGSHMAALFWAPLGTADPFLFQQVGGPVSFIAAGTFIGGIRTAPVTPAGGTALFIVSVWEVADPSHCGISDLIAVDTGDPTFVPTEDPGNLVSFGLTGFDLNSSTCLVPEPSVYALSILCAIGFCLIPRKQRANGSSNP